MRKPERLRCQRCGDEQDLSFIVWEGRRLCAGCFSEEVAQYAQQFPYLLADELHLDTLSVPEYAE